MVQDDRLTVLLWLWDGWRPVYDYRNVNALVRMLADHLTIPHATLCITDRPAGIECATYPLWDLDITLPGMHPARPNCYRRLKMFSPWAATEFPGRVLSLDLDCIITGALDPLITDHDFRINVGRSAPYNGGMWLLRTGSRPQVWERFDANAPALTRQLGWIGSDQAWISYILPGEPTWGATDGVYHYSTSRPGDALPGCRAMFFAGSTKPWHAEFARLFPDLAASYRRYYQCP